MKNFFLLLVLVCTVQLAVHAQNTTKIVTDSLKVYQIGSNAELILENGSRGKTGAFLRNKGNGRTEFAFAVDSVWQTGNLLKFSRAGTITTINLQTSTVNDVIGLRDSLDKKVSDSRFLDSLLAIRNSTIAISNYNWSTLPGKPATFPPAAHTHVIGDVISLQDELDRRVTLNDVQNITGIKTFNASTYWGDSWNTQAVKLGTDGGGRGKLMLYNTTMDKVSILENNAWRFLTSVGFQSIYPNPNLVGYSNLFWPNKTGTDTISTLTDIETRVPNTRTINGKALSSDITLSKSDIGLPNVDNTSDQDKPVSIATQTALDGKINVSAKGVANGVATIDSTGKIPLSQINDVLLGAVNWKGTYAVLTNTPALPSASTTKGWYYVVTDSGGVVNGEVYSPKDWIVSNGIAWQRVGNNNTITSVNGKQGAVTLKVSDLANDAGYITAADAIQNQNGSAQTAAFYVNGNSATSGRFTIGSAPSTTAMLNITGTTQNLAGGIFYQGNGSSLSIFSGTGNQVQVATQSAYSFGASSTTTSTGILAAGRALNLKSFNDGSLGTINLVMGGTNALTVANDASITTAGTIGVGGSLVNISGTAATASGFNISPAGTTRGRFNVVQGAGNIFSGTLINDVAIRADNSTSRIALGVGTSTASGWFDSNGLTVGSSASTDANTKLYVAGGAKIGSVRISNSSNSALIQVADGNSSSNISANGTTLDFGSATTTVENLYGGIRLNTKDSIKRYVNVTNFDFLGTDTTRNGAMVRLPASYFDTKYAALVDGLVSGGATSIVNTDSVQIASATYRINGVVYSSTTKIIPDIPASSAGLSRYVIVYGKTDNTLDTAGGSQGVSAVEPSLPGNTAKIASILVGSSGLVANSNLADYAKLSADNTFSGINTFNKGITVTGAGSVGGAPMVMNVLGAGYNTITEIGTYVVKNVAGRKKTYHVQVASAPFGEPADVDFVYYWPDVGGTFLNTGYCAIVPLVSAGTANKFLTNNGSGQPYWASVPSKTLDDILQSGNTSSKGATFGGGVKVDVGIGSTAIQVRNSANSNTMLSLNVNPGGGGGALNINDGSGTNTISLDGSGGTAVLKNTLTIGNNSFSAGHTIFSLSSGANTATFQNSSGTIAWLSDLVGKANASNFADNSYTPTLTGVLNVNTLSLNNAYYSRNGNRVHVALSISVTPTAANTTTQFTFTVPIVGMTNGNGVVTSFDYGYGAASYNSSTEGFIMYRPQASAAHTINVQFDYTL